MRKPVMVTVWAALDPEKEQSEFVVSGNYYPGHPGRWYRRNGDPGDPPEPAEFAISSIKVPSGEEVLNDLTDAEVERIESAAMEAIGELA